MPVGVFGQVVDELDEVRVLVAAQARLAPLLQLAHEAVVAGVAAGDHERLHAHRVVGLDPHRGRLEHARMLDEHVLDLDRGGPQPADLDHVVGAALVDVVAVLVDAVAIAGEEQVAVDRGLGLLVLVPVVGQRGVAAHLQVPDLAVGDRRAQLVEQRRARSPGTGLPLVPGRTSPGRLEQ